MYAIMKQASIKVKLMFTSVIKSWMNYILKYISVVSMKTKQLWTSAQAQYSNNFMEQDHGLWKTIFCSLTFPLSFSRWLIIPPCFVTPFILLEKELLLIEWPWYSPFSTGLAFLIVSAVIGLIGFIGLKVGKVKSSKPPKSPKSSKGLKGLKGLKGSKGLNLWSGLKRLVYRNEK